MKTGSILLIIMLLFSACEKKESAEKSNGTNSGTPGSGTQAPASSNSGNTSFNYTSGNYDWIGQYNDQLYATDITSGSHILRYSAADRKLTMLKKINSTDRFQAIAHSMDQQGNIYFYAIADGGNVGVMKMNSEGQIAWKKKLKMNLSQYNNTGDMRPAAIKLVNGYLWALSSHFLFKIDPANGNVLKTTGIGSTGDRWAPGQDIIRAGEHIMVQMGGGQLYFYILNVNDLSVIKTVNTSFTLNPTSGYLSNTILDVDDNRFFALTHYRLQGSLFPRGVIIEFDSDGKIINGALMKDGLDQFEVTRMHRDADGNYAVAYNTTIELATNIKTKDVLVFNRNLELIHKASLPPTLSGSAISYKGSTAALFDLKTSNRINVEWIDMKNPGCKLNNRLTNIKLETLAFKNPVVKTDIKTIGTQMSFLGSEDMSHSVEDVTVTQTTQKCSN